MKSRIDLYKSLDEVKTMAYKFSVVISAYNLEKFLDESVQSIIKQTIGFKESIQLILVNDGSTDGTSEICKGYQNQYPNNVIYLSQENKGVSAARNAGLYVATGKYINFFDGDDIWESDAFEKAWEYLEEHEKEIDVVACAQRFFEAREGYRETYYKFRKGDRIIDIKEEPTAIELSVGSAFFRLDSIKGLQFDERLDYGENAKFMTIAILRKAKYGAIQSSEYRVRRRADGTSVTQNHKLTWQTTTLKYCHKFLLQLCVEYPEERRYIQNVILKTLKYRVVHEVLSYEHGAEEYMQDIRELVLGMGDDVIISAPYMGYPLKLYLLKMKYGEEIQNMIKVKKTGLYIEGKRLVNLAKKTMNVEEIEVKDGMCYIRGQIICAMGDPIVVHAKDGKEELSMRIREDKQRSVISVFGDEVCKGREFEVEVPRNKDISKISFILEVGNRKIELEPVYRGELKGVKDSFLRVNDQMVLLNEQGKLVIKSYTILRRLKFYLKH